MGGNVRRVEQSLKGSLVLFALAGCGARAVTPLELPDASVSHDAAPPSGPCLPTCFERIFTACPVEPSCTTETRTSPAGGREVVTCYATGTEDIAELDDPQMYSGRGLSASGALCYTYTGVASPDGSITVTYFDPSGRQVATQLSDSSVPAVSITCDGVTTRVDFASPACVAEFGTGMCADGTCPRH